MTDDIIVFKPRPYRTSEPPSTPFGGWLNDPDRLEGWLADHPRDAPFLFELLQARKNEKR
jgi:hypothetical protein